DLLNPVQAIKLDVPLKLKEQRHVIPPATVVSEVEMIGDDGAAHPLASINGNKPRSIVDAYAMLLKTQAGKPIAIKLADGGEKSITPQAVAPPDAVVQAKKKLGITVEALTPMLAE